jgi:hypothetical protein
VGIIDESRNIGVAKRKKTKRFVRDKLPKKKSKRASKSKGKRLEKMVRDLLQSYLNLTDDDLRVPVGSERGADIKRTSVRGRTLYPFSTECKNRERLNVWEAWEQCRYNAELEESFPLLVIKRNNTKPLAVLDFELFLTYLRFNEGESPY